MSKPAPEDPRDDLGNVRRASERVDYRLSYEPTDEPRHCHSWGIFGPELKNAYYGRPGHENSSETGSGDWEDPEHPDPSEPEDVHIARWFQVAVREAVHESLEWFWVDGSIYLDPHGEQANAIHRLSAEFAAKLLALRGDGVPTAGTGEDDLRVAELPR